MTDFSILDKIVEAVIAQESSGDPFAESPVGAQGLMQLMPDTAREVMEELGLDPETYDPFNPKQNRELGTRYLKNMLILFGDYRLALAAYNAGPGRVSRLTQKWGDDYCDIKEHLPDETKSYVQRITARLVDRGVFI